MIPLAAVSIYEALLALVALVTVLTAVTQLRDRMRRNLREERDELRHLNEKLAAEVATLQAKTDLTSVAALIADHETRASDRAERQAERDRSQLAVLQRLADSLDLKIKNERAVSHERT